MQIYVGNIPNILVEEELEKLFAQYGDVLSVNYIRDRETGKFRGFGFVEMAVKTEAIEGISALENREYGGHTLYVNEARPRQPRQPRDTW
jgi:RNA recognition motif-containing protein